MYLHICNHETKYLPRTCYGELVYEHGRVSLSQMWFVGVMLEREEQTCQRCLTMFQRKLREGHYKWAHKQVVSTSNWDTFYHETIIIEMSNFC